MPEKAQRPEGVRAGVCVVACVWRRLAAHTASPVLMLRLYSAWALRNLAHKSSIAVKKGLMQVRGLMRLGLERG